MLPETTLTSLAGRTEQQLGDECGAITAYFDMLTTFSKADISGLTPEDKQAISKLKGDIINVIIPEEMKHQNILQDFLTKFTGITPEMK